MATKTTKPVTSNELSNSKKVLGDIIKSINSRTKSHYIDTGRDLIRASEILEHGKLGPWLKENFGWSTSTARNYMNAAKLVDKNAKVADLQPAAVMALAAPSVPESVITEVLADIDLGLRPTVTEIKTKIKAAKAPKPKTEGDAEEASEGDAAPAAEKDSYHALLSLLRRADVADAVKAASEFLLAVKKDSQPASAALGDDEISEEDFEELDLGVAA